MKTKREEREKERERKEEFAGYGKLGSKFAKITTEKNTEASIKIRIRFPRVKSSVTENYFHFHVHSRKNTFSRCDSRE